jgi:hypothetical protein
MQITAQSARRSAYLFNWGSIAAVLLPIPFLPLFFGASIFLYAINRNHPEPKVGYYMQRSANRFYLVTASVIVLGKFIPESSNTMNWYFLLWLLAVFALLIPSAKDIYTIWHDSWVDIDTGDK